MLKKIDIMCTCGRLTSKEVSTLKKYADRVCGGIAMVKKLYVDELRRKRIAKNLSCKEMDRIIGLGPEWPTVEEIENNPNLFTLHFHQKLTLLRLDSHEAWERLFDLIGEDVDTWIKKFLENQLHVDEAVAGFKANIVYFHATLYGPDPDEYVRKVLAGEPVKQFAPNMLSPREYASSYIHSCITTELRESDQKLT